MKTNKRKTVFWNWNSGGDTMFVLSNLSKLRLERAEPALQQLFNEVAKKFDCSIICSHRSEAEQEKAYKNHKSKLQFPHSKHNSLPSKAVDVLPFPVDWKNTEKMRELAAVVLETAKELNIKIRWGGDWDMDGDTSDNKFNDLAHYELV